MNYSLDDGHLGVTPLMRAVSKNGEEGNLIATELIALGHVRSGLFTKDKKGRTALDWARLTRNDVAVSILKLAMESEIDSSRFNSAYAPGDINSYAVSMNSQFSDALLTALAQSKISDAIKVIHDAVDLYRDEVEKDVVGQVYYIDKPSSDGSGRNTPLILAAGLNNSELVNLLIDKGAGLNTANRYGHNPLTWAACCGHSDIVRLLLFKGADINHQTVEGRTVMHCACMYLKAKVVHTVLKFLYEKFLTFRITKHQSGRYDSERWSRYASILENFVNIKDKEGRRALQVVPSNLRTSARLLNNTENRSQAYDPDIPEDDSFSFTSAHCNVHDQTVRQNFEGMEAILALSPSHRDRGDRSVASIGSGSLGDSQAASQAQNRDYMGNVYCDDEDDRSALGSVLTMDTGHGEGGGEILVAGRGEMLAPVRGEGEVSGVEEVEEARGSHVYREDDWDRDGQNSSVHGQSQNQSQSQMLGDGLSVGGGLSVGPEASASMAGDSMFTHDTDFNIVRFTDNHGKQTLTDAHSVASAMPLAAEHTAIHHMFEEARQKLDVWRVSALQEEKLGEDVHCWLQCGHRDAVENMAEHIKTVCPHRAVECPECRNILYSKDIKEHRKAQCPKRLVGCPNAWQGCTEILTFDSLERHMEMRCQVRLVPCRLECGRCDGLPNKFGFIYKDGDGSLMPYNVREQHEKLYCCKRIMQCDQCAENMVAETYPHHLLNTCPERRVRCSVGCGVFIKLKEKDHHERNICQAPCKWKCGRVIGPQQKKNLHERTECPNRPVMCPNPGCKVVGFTAEHITEHAQTQCGDVVEYCPDSCGVRLKRKHIGQHREQWYGDCTERMVRCPSNYVGWKVVVGGKHEGIVLKYERKALDRPATVDPGAGNADATSSPVAIAAASAGADVVSASVPSTPAKSTRRGRPLVVADHSTSTPGVVLCQPVAQKGRRGQGQNQEQASGQCAAAEVPEASYRAINTAGVGADCPQTPLFALPRDALYIRFEDRHEWVDYWDAVKTGYILPVCKLQGDLKISEHRNAKFDCCWVRYSHLGHHLQERCIHRLVMIPKGDVPSQAPQSAYDVREKELGSGGIASDGDEEGAGAGGMAGSPTSRSSKRKILSRGGSRKASRGMETSQSVDGGLALAKPDSRAGAADDPLLLRGFHVPYKDAVSSALIQSQFLDFANTSDEIVACEYCSDKIAQDDYAKHVKGECGSLPQRCKLGCGMKMQRRFIDSHAQNDCPKRNMSCPQCFAEVWAEDLDAHLKDDCLENSMECQLGCGQVGLTRLTEEEHRVRKCTYRMMKCLCGEEMMLKDHNDHLISDCMKKLSLCPQGCGAQIPRNTVDYHMENECTNKSIFLSGIVNCPIGCGLSLRRSAVLEHVAYECTQRLSDCPLKCGNSIKIDKMRTHLYFCPMRMMTCETGMTCCNKMMLEWYRAEDRNEPSIVERVVEEDALGSLEQPGAEWTARSHSMTDSDQIFSDSHHSDSTVITQAPLAADVSTVAGTALEGMSVVYRTEEAMGHLSKPLVAFHGEGMETSQSTTSTNRLNPRGHHPAMPVPRLGLDETSIGETVDTVKTIDTSDSSIYMEDGKFYFRDRLRMVPCRRHEVTVLMAAVRANEFPLAEYAIKTTRGLDLNLQSAFGDTALTISCRYGRYSMVELLIQNGCDLNMETIAGRTALLEAVKVNAIAIIDLLIYNGALVSFKTTKHGKTAMDWAQQLKLVDVMRTLELGAIVQTQVKQIFNYISCGETEKIRALIADGDFFDANTPFTMYKLMEENIVYLRTSNAKIEKFKKDLRGYNDELVGMEKDALVEKEHYDNCERDIDVVYGHLNKLRINMNKFFVIYEHHVSSLGSADVAEVARMRHPVEAVRLSVLACAILLEIMPADREVGLSMDETRKWWPEVFPVLQDPTGTVKRLKAFSIAKLQTPLMVNLLARARRLFTQMMEVLGQFESAQKAEKASLLKSEAISRLISRQGTRVPTAIGEERRDDSPTKPALKWSKSMFMNAEVVEEEAIPNYDALNLSAATANPVAEDRIPDEDWDSEAENAGGGSWVKGEWVPVIKKKEKWWEGREKKPDSGKGKRRKKQDMLVIENGSPGSGAPMAAPAPDASPEGGEEAWSSDAVLAVYSRKFADKPVEILTAAEKVALEEAKWDHDGDQDDPHPYIGGHVTGANKITVRPNLVSAVVQAEQKAIDDALAAEHAAQEKVRLAAEAAEAKRLAAEEEIRNYDPYSVTNRRKKRLNPAQQAKLAEEERIRKIEEAAAAEHAEIQRIADERSAMDPVELIENMVGKDSAAAGKFVTTIVTLLFGIDCVAHESIALAKANHEYMEVVNRQHDLKDNMMRAQAKVSNKDIHKGLCEKKLFNEIQQCKLFLKRTKIYREKLRIARLLNQVTPTGHTAISWAAAHGNYEALEEIMTHGGSIGYTEDLIHLSARFIQMSYRLYRFLSAKPTANANKDVPEMPDHEDEPLVNPDAVEVDDESSVGTLTTEQFVEQQNARMLQKEKNKEAATKNFSLKDAGSLTAMVDAMKSGDVVMSNTELVEKIFILKEERQRILNTIQHRRAKLRFPIPEAAYHGKWEAVDRIHERKLFHVHFSQTYCFPSPPFPRIRVLREGVVKKRTGMLALVAHGMSDLAAGEYIPGHGWVLANDARESFGHCQENCKRIWDKVMDDRDKFIANRRRIRYLINAKRMMEQGEKDLTEAIKNREYKRVIAIVQSGGGSIDHEIDIGYTALLAASEENVGSQTHAWMLNDGALFLLFVAFLLYFALFYFILFYFNIFVFISCPADGVPVLAVEYLLDRENYRPAVNLEVGSGQTALIRACDMNRVYVVQSLLDRGANVNYQNKFGKTAMHYTCAIGAQECVRLLLERGADMLLKDKTGQSPYDVANEQGFNNILQMISQYSGGFLGPVRVTRGRIVDCVSCPNACGLTMYPYERKAHVLECTYREIECPLNCGIRRLQKREEEEHLANECIKRTVSCKRCHGDVVCDVEEEHWETDCPERLLPCPNSCGNTVRLRDMPGHLAGCTYRLVLCSQSCGMEIMARNQFEHCKRECVNRRLSCPLRCAKLILFKRLEDHMANLCPMRSMQCRWCAEPLVASAIAKHENGCALKQELCPQKCGRWVLSTELKAHMAGGCGCRFAPCPLDCGLKVRLSDLDAHTARQCPNRMMECPNSCTRIMSPAEQQELLASVFNNNSSILHPLTAVASSLDSTALDAVGTGAAAGTTITADKSVSDSITGGDSAAVRIVGDDDEAFNYTLPGAQASVDGVPDTEMGALSLCQPCGGGGHISGPSASVASVSAASADPSVHNMNSAVNNSAVSTMTAMTESAHYIIENGVYRTKAKIMARTLDLHLRYDCPERMTVCSLCRVEFKGKELENHMKYLCDERVVDCRIHGCLKTLPFKDREAHERFECRFRLTACVQGCDVLVHAIDMGRHCAKACEYRQVPCAMQCGMKVRHYALQSHMENDCPRRHGTVPNTTLNSPFGSPLASPALTRKNTQTNITSGNSPPRSPAISRQGSRATLGTSPVASPVVKSRKAALGPPATTPPPTTTSTTSGISPKSPPSNTRKQPK